MKTNSRVRAVKEGAPSSPPKRPTSKQRLVKRKRRRNTKYYLTCMLGVLLISIGLVGLMRVFVPRYLHKIENLKLVEDRSKLDPLIAHVKDDLPQDPIPDKEKVAEKSSRRAKAIRDWYKQQHEKGLIDLSGLLKVTFNEEDKSTTIETPLFMNKEDHLFYMNHDRYKRYSRDGEAGMLRDNRKRNICVWDHNFYNGERFARLASLADDPAASDQISIHLELEDGSQKDYEVISVQKRTDEGFFKISFENESDYKSWLLAQLGDEILERFDPKSVLTIHTCYSMDGRIKTVLFCVPKST